ncbi:ABC-type Fe3+/spermidine/putrescine transport system ATPase subunit [Rhodoligotrophos appendicifer]|uniref:ABC transporter ATP-binding protein n=1 Tax=Rhodoligotrophos appendicifer TaxID=987056 RepID=UPI001185E9B1|nr:ABC transporter ATP-binding protein [Rhodoligotrophos appendicifer]
MSLSVEALDKSYGAHKVLKSVTETFAECEISVLLGPSGCGKTTTLRCIAGLERPSAGQIRIDGRLVYRATPPVWVPVEQRRISMVFQSYAIWPHMTVFENVSLPLKAAGQSREKIMAAVQTTLQQVNLDAFADRSATQLSGGQQQRVALARAIVSESPVILMDEPLSNLDAKLRVTMRGEIRALQRRLGRTILFVTHDQEEAMSLGDTVYLFREGQVIQKGPPKALYDNPATRYAAEFLGRANILTEFSWSSAPDGAVISLPGGTTLPAPSDAPPPDGAVLCIRPEKWRVVSPGHPGSLNGRVIDTSFVGDRTECRIDSPLGEVLVMELNAPDRNPGDPVGLMVTAADIKVIGRD